MDLLKTGFWYAIFLALALPAAVALMVLITYILHVRANRSARIEETLSKAETDSNRETPPAEELFCASQNYRRRARTSCASDRRVASHRRFTLE